MTSEERDARLTAYALSDPGVSQLERQEIETMMANDSSARQAVEETRQMAQLLSEGLAAEQAAMPATKPVTIPATKPERRSPAWMKQLVAASLVLFAIGGTTLMVWSKWKRDVDGGVAQLERHSTWDTQRGATTKSGNVDFEVTYGDREYKANASFGGVPNRESPDQRAVRGTVGVIAPPRTEPAKDSVTFTPATGTGTVDAPKPHGDPNSKPDPQKGDGKAEGKPDDGNKAPGRPTSRDGYAAKPTAATPRPGLPPLPADPGQPGTSKELSDQLKKASESAYDPRDATKDTRADNDRYPGLIENGFIQVKGLDALSTFGVDVDTASYAIVRKYLSMGQLPPTNAVRLEEMVNYFPYADKVPDGDDPFAVSVEMAECPWQPAHRLVRLGLKAKPIASDKRPPSNLVFLIDVSGSMNEPNKLPLVKASLKLLVNQLGENDRIAMVVYAGASGLVLDSTPATKKETILNALDQLQAGGSTAGASGLQLAYEVAVKNFIKNGTNRVILCTDGDWNVGTTSTEALVKMIEEKRETGVFLSVFGFGMGNLRDEMMVKLAGKGNGNYGYIDTLREAHKAFVEQMGGTLVTVAKDVKIQVEFNPEVIKSYRLLGYEKRLLAAKDFHDDKKDAGEMGAGHVVTALYELVPVGAPDPVAGKVDPLRYQKDPEPKPAVKSDKSGEAFVLKMRHKKPDSDTSTLRELPIADVTKHYEKASEDFQFSAAVASFAMLLRDSQYKGSSNYALVLELAESAKSHDPGEYRAEFIEMVKKAKSLAGK
jgi:Ca-activated chloride channel family protein